MREKLPSDLVEILKNTYLANTKRFPKTEFWTYFGTRVPPYRAEVGGGREGGRGKKEGRKIGGRGTASLINLIRLRVK